jgi:hypothetical protein
MHRPRRLTFLQAMTALNMRVDDLTANDEVHEEPVCGNDLELPDDIENAADALDDEGDIEVC